MLLIAIGADLRVRDSLLRSTLSYGNASGSGPSVKAQRVAELKAAFRAGCHPSQVQRRKDDRQIP